MTSEQWLAANAIECVPLSSRITVTQCKANNGHHYCCESCSRGGRKYSGPIQIKIRRKKSEKGI